MRYLQKTKNYGLKFCKDDLDSQGFVDANWANDSTDRKSYTGFCFKLSGSSVSWESKKQKTVALSSTEAEYMAALEASKEAIYFKNLFLELFGISKDITLFNNNQSAQKLSANSMFHKRSKHIDIKHHFIRDSVANGLVNLEYLQTAEMPADILTKSLCSAKHYNFFEDLGVINVK